MRELVCDAVEAFWWLLSTPVRIIITDSVSAGVQDALARDRAAHPHPHEQIEQPLRDLSPTKRSWADRLWHPR